MVTFTINIPQMLAYIPAPWILWVIRCYHRVTKTGSRAFLFRSPKVPRSDKAGNGAEFHCFPQNLGEVGKKEDSKMEYPAGWWFMVDITIVNGDYNGL